MMVWTSVISKFSSTPIGEYKKSKIAHSPRLKIGNEQIGKIVSVYSR